MKRRKFLGTTLKAGLLPFALNGFSFRTLASTPMLQALAKASAGNGKVFVLIQLNGGNDGLNTVIPFDQYDNLAIARSNIMISESQVLALSGSSTTGLHPSMSGIRTMYDNGLVSLIQSVGYPNPNFSHFRATDIWLSASDSDEYLSSGWMGRYLDEEYPGFPVGYPNPDMPDPLAIQIGSSVSPALMGAESSLGMAITNPNSFYQLISGTTDPAPNTPAGHELTYIRLVSQQTQQYSVSIKNAASNGSNASSLYPSGNSLADQLKIVAQLIKGGLKTPVYMVSLGGFDTHSAQVDTADKSKGAHATLLQRISEAVFAFQDDLKLLGIDDKVAGMTFSEFGRRIRSNASLGTDHGAAAPVFVFGKGVNPGIIGTSPIIPASVSVNDNVPMQYDFRQIYAAVMLDWFGVDDSIVDTKILLKNFDKLPVFKAQSSGISKGNATSTQNVSLMQNYPNPVTDLSWIDFTLSESSTVQVRLFDNQGRMISTLAEGTYTKGTHTVTLDASQLPAGNYFYQLITPKMQVSRSLLKL